MPTAVTVTNYIFGILVETFLAWASACAFSLSQLSRLTTVLDLRDVHSSGTARAVASESGRQTNVWFVEVRAVVQP